MGSHPTRVGGRLTHVLGSMLVALILGASALLALGSPDISGAREFFTANQPDRAGALAAIELVVWVLVAAIVLLQLREALRQSAVKEIRDARRRFRSRAALVAGILVFVGGAVHHQAGGGSLCCGDTVRAEQLLR